MPHVSICICTYRRPELLQRLFAGVRKLETRRHTHSVVVVDNDAAASAREAVERFRAESGLPVAYGVEPTRNFALVRNHTLALATGDFIAFVDDDEVPVPEWLDTLVAAQEKYGADGVLGPVRPYFDTPPPRWILKGKLCDRPVHPTGMVMSWKQTRTGNVLLKRSLFTEHQLSFDPQYGTGGEDVAFFKAAIAAGHKFVWCEEAPAYELVPPDRLKKSYFLRRALLQGRVSLQNLAGSRSLVARLKVAAHSLVALIAYAVALPFLALAGFHVVMKYLIKLCHHLSRMLACVGIQVARQRTF